MMSLPVYSSQMAPPYDAGYVYISKNHVTKISRTVMGAGNEAVYQEIAEVAPAFIAIIDEYIALIRKEKKLLPLNYNMSMDTYELVNYGIYDAYTLPEASLVKVMTLDFNPDFKEEDVFHSGKGAFKIEVNVALTSSLSSQDVQSLSGNLLIFFVQQMKLKKYKKIYFKSLALEEVILDWGIFKSSQNLYVRSDLHEKYLVQFSNSFDVFIATIEKSIQQASAELGLSFTAKSAEQSLNNYIVHDFLDSYFSFENDISTIGEVTTKMRDAFKINIAKSLHSAALMQSRSLETLSVKSIISKVVTRFNQQGIKAVEIDIGQGDYAIYYKEHTQVYIKLLDNVDIIAAWFHANQITTLTINPDWFDVGGVAHRTESYRKANEVSLNGNDFDKLDFILKSPPHQAFFNHLDVFIGKGERPQKDPLFLIDQ